MEKLCRAVIPFRPKIGDYRYLLARLTQTTYIKGAETDINFYEFRTNCILHSFGSAPPSPNNSSSYTTLIGESV